MPWSMYLLVMQNWNNLIKRGEEYAGQVYPITYYIYFVRGGDGLWKIYRY